MSKLVVYRLKLSHYILILYVFGFICNSCNAFIKIDYSGAQLLRLYNNNHINSSTINTLVNVFDGNKWKEEKDILDISFPKNQLLQVKHYLDNLNINYDIIINDLQKIINESSTNRTKRSTKMNWSNYQTYETIIHYINSLPAQYPSIATIINIGTSFEGRDLLVLRITNNNASNNAIWIDGGIHAREWISPAAVTYIINYLLTNWNTLPKTLKNKTWYILPVFNPDGYSYTWTNDRLWRKNRKTLSTSNCIGVDLNRNFDIDWNGSSQSSNPCSETFRGTSAFSEKETNAVSTFLTNNKVNLKAMLTYHSYGQYILWPWGYTYSGTAPNAAEMKTVADTAAANIKALTGYSYSALRDTALGIIAGASDDWAKSALNIPYTYTIELRDKGHYAFILPANQIIHTSKEALEVVKAVANAI